MHGNWRGKSRRRQPGSQHREIRSPRHVNPPEAKLKAVRRAVRNTFPTADIDQMLAEIASGYRD